MTSVEVVHLSGVLAEYRITADLLGHDGCNWCKDVGGLTTETTAVEVGYGMDRVECHTECICNSGFVGSDILTTGVVINIITDPPCSSLMSFELVVCISGGPTKSIFFDYIAVIE